MTYLFLFVYTPHHNFKFEPRNAHQVFWSDKHIRKINTGKIQFTYQNVWGSRSYLRNNILIGYRYISSST